MAESKSLRIAYGEALAELGAENDKIVVLDADLSNATMTNRFSAVYPDRFFDFGIAEANMACAAAAIEGPVYIRVARPVCECFTDESTPFVPGKANIMREGGDVAIIAMGLMVAEALKAADLLAAEGIRATVVNMHTVKPLDEDAVLSVAEKCGAVVTAEEHSVIGGLGSAVAEVLAGRSSAKFARVGIEDRFGQSGTPAELFADYGLTAENIAENARRLVK